jgi:antibiotic biosynthesis monooxygenase (ABM) superfamily enzyme
LVSRSILNPSIGYWPLLANGIIFTAILTIGLTYFAMPILSRLLRRWLYPSSRQL